jgi:hypothetical protein
MNFIITENIVTVKIKTQVSTGLYIFSNPEYEKVVYGMSCLCMYVFTYVCVICVCTCKEKGMYACM